jgi:hypothetical protein
LKLKISRRARMFHRLLTCYTSVQTIYGPTDIGHPQNANVPHSLQKKLEQEWIGESELRLGSGARNSKSNRPLPNIIQAILKPAFSKKMPVLPEIRSPNVPVLRTICHPDYPIGRGFSLFRVNGK